MLDAVVISDIHLGSENCQAREVVHLLDSIRRGDLLTRRLILNGDVFDSIDFRRLNKHHWKVLSELRKLSDQVEITWINGNHDGPAEIVSHLLGVNCTDEIIVESGGRKILFLHGHRFDEFIARYPLLTFIADRIYNHLQRLDTSHAFARFAKRRSKTFLRCAEKIEHNARKYAARRGCDAVCCGHTHHAVEKRNGEVQYFNSGCWTEKPCTYLTVCEGEVELHRWAADMDTVLEEEAAVA
ncbi:MAG: UDP-2,3-diacylglucosamine diphosphatase [Gemmataceae bacterium]